MPEGFPFDVVRAREAAAYVLDRVPEYARTWFHVLKLLYLAEREALRSRGRPICGGWYVGMPDGPVMSEVYECMKGAADARIQAQWSLHFVSGGEGNEYYDIRVVEMPPRRRLSRADESILGQIVAAHGAKSYGDLWTFVHDQENVPEYEDPTVAGQRRGDIPLDRLLHDVGRSDNAVAAILEEARSLRVHASASAT